MKKTHEKSSICTVIGTAKLKNPEEVVLQIEATGQRNGDGFIYLVESVAAEDYDRTTAEGRAAAAEKGTGRVQEGVFRDNGQPECRKRSTGRTTGTGARRGPQLQKET